MGAAQSIPVISEVVTVVDSGARTLAAGACEIVGQHDEAKKLIDQAGQDWKHYADVELFVANTRVIIAKAQGDEETADHILGEEKEAWTEVAENTPGVGHVIGLVRYAEGDTAGGDRAMMAATRSTLVIGATVATGGAGAFVAAGAAAATGLAADGAFTLANSIGKHEYAPVGTFAGVTQAVKTGSVGDWISAVEIPVGDMAAGALEGTVRGRVAPREVMANQLGERATHYNSTLDNYRPFRGNSSNLQQISNASMMSNAETARMIHSFGGEEWIEMQPSQTYDFVRLRDGTYRAISHSDAARAANIHPNQGAVGHTTLLPAGEEEAVAAGEIQIGEQGQLLNANAQSGHFRVPFEVFRKQIGRIFPRRILTFASPAFARMFSEIGRSTSFLTHCKKILIYTPALLVIVMDQDPDTSLKNADYAVVVDEGGNGINQILTKDKPTAMEVYNSVDRMTSKVLVKRSTSQVESYSRVPSYDLNKYKKVALSYRPYAVSVGRDLTVPPKYARFVVAFQHDKCCGRALGFLDETVAERTYAQSPKDHGSKVLYDMHKHQILKSQGSTTWFSEKALSVLRKDENVALSRSSVYWAPAEHKVMPPNMITGGQDSGKSIFIARATYKNGLHPGKVDYPGTASRSQTYVSYDGKEIAVNGNIEVLVGHAPAVRWVTVSGRFSLDALKGAVPVPGGFEANGDPLFIALATVSSNIQHCGKVKIGSHANIPYSGQEKIANDYSVLVFNAVYWAATPRGVVPSNAIEGGSDVNNKRIYIARSQYKGGIHPGKIDCPDKGKSQLYISYDSKEIALNDNIDVLVGYRDAVRWVAVSGRFSLNSLGGAVPVPGGMEANRDPLFIAQTRITNGVVHCGKIKVGSHANIPYNGQEKIASDYEVLVYA